MDKKKKETTDFEGATKGSKRFSQDWHGTGSRSRDDCGVFLWNRVSKWGTFCFVLFEMMLNLPRDGRWGACRHLRSSVLVFFVYSFSIYIVFDSSIVLVRHKKCDIFFCFVCETQEEGGKATHRKSKPRECFAIVLCQFDWIWQQCFDIFWSRSRTGGSEEVKVEGNEEAEKERKKSDKSKDIEVCVCGQWAVQWRGGENIPKETG